MKNYVELREKNGVSDYRVAEDTGIPKSTFLIGNPEEVNLKSES